jgi:hypothetical protein
MWPNVKGLPQPYPSNTLLYGLQSFVAPAVCKAVYKQNGIAAAISDHTLCAGSDYSAAAPYSVTTPKVATCPGDSGDPLFVGVDENGTVLTQLNNATKQTAFYQLGTNSVNALGCISKEFVGSTSTPTPTIRASVRVLCDGSDDLLQVAASLDPNQVCAVPGSRAG